METVTKEEIEKMKQIIDVIVKTLTEMHMKHEILSSDKIEKIKEWGNFREKKFIE